MIASLLIANRGEIACRIVRTARTMGIRTVAVYSDADATALHVRQADEAVHIGASPAAESYLRGDRIIAAAKATGAEAIHPGYGFLSENADFAQAVIDAGLIWVGPRPASIRAMGLKDAAKRLMQQAGVPTTPGYLGDDQSAARLQAEADAIGYPVLIKAVAGGGGKGMRRVDAAQQFTEMLESCRREAAAAFGDERVLIEKYILAPRHIEVQVFGDTHGNIVHLFERDCSLQRRHQKVIEEAPAPGMDEATRDAICAVAVKAARAVDYVGAGTIEFIADASEGLRADRIWFMEMNTRLQVEHPVTEEITGVDLVGWQLRVASGEALPLKQDDIHINGHAIEARLYAEDPAKGFLPSVGRLERCIVKDPNIRVDTGYEREDSVSPYYDPMVAKLISYRSTREYAISALLDALDDTVLWPVKSNAGFLYRVLIHDEFEAERISTGFIEQHASKLIMGPKPAPDFYLDAASNLVSQYEDNWGMGFTGFRLNRPPNKRVRILYGDHHQEVVAPDDYLDNDLHTRTGRQDVALVTDCGETFAFALDRPRGSGNHHAADGDILAPMPGKVTSVEVAAGQSVTKGQKLLTLEAMKMEHALTAPFDGVVAELNATPGAQVQVDALLVRIDPAGETSE